MPASLRASRPSALVDAAAAPASAACPGLTLALIIAINTGFAAILSIEDSRPFWHPLITAQSLGLSIAYVVNAASPWDKTHPVWRLAAAVAIGTVIGFACWCLIKGPVIATSQATRIAELIATGIPRAGPW